MNGRSCASWLRTAVPALVTGAILSALAAPDAVLAQGEIPSRIPRPAAGTPALVLPLQRAVPLPGGGWPGAASSRKRLLDRFAAELDFALEERGDQGPRWMGPRQLRRMSRRNPVLQLDPDRLAVDALPAAGEDLPASLHGQLRAMAAASGARFALLPVELSYRRGGSPASACPGSKGEGEGNESGVEDSARRAGARTAEPGRPVLCVAFLDVRGARVLWRGAVVGPPVAADSPALLANLASRLLDLFSG